MQELQIDFRLYLITRIEKEDIIHNTLKNLLIRDSKVKSAVCDPYVFQYIEHSIYTRTSFESVEICFSKNQVLPVKTVGEVKDFDAQIDKGYIELKDASNKTIYKIEINDSRLSDQFKFHSVVKFKN